MENSIFDKWDNTIDVEGLKKDVEAVASNSTKYEEVPFGTYEVKVDSMELKASKASGNPMLAIAFTILDGKYKKQKIFYNQSLTNKYGLHNANEILRALSDGAVEIKFESYSSYANLILDVLEVIHNKLEYALEYSENEKGYKVYKITEVFEVE